MKEFSPTVIHLLSLLEYDHLPPHLQAVSMPFGRLAEQMVLNLGHGLELEVGLRKLVESKDCFVRQAVIDARGEQ